MAVLVKGFSVVVRKRAIEKKYPGRGEAFVTDVPTGTLYADGEIARLAFETLQEAR